VSIFCCYVLGALFVHFVGFAISFLVVTVGFRLPVDLLSAAQGDGEKMRLDSLLRQA
jgi:hypothetical protein